MAHDADITGALAALTGADHDEALARFVALVYRELRAIAQAQLRSERPDHSLQATALVHEAYLRLLGGPPRTWHDRRHFFRAAAETMRHVLVDHARQRRRLKRGGNRQRVPLDCVDLAFEHDPDEVLALDDAFRRLEKQDARAADVVRLRFFAGLSVQETAAALDVSERTVRREWAYARAWLHEAMEGRPPPTEDDTP